MDKVKILIINGPNLNILGEREKNIYGEVSLQKINAELLKIANKEKCEIKTFQSNSESEIIEEIQNAKDKFDGIVINPAALTHYSIAIRDALLAVDLPTIEVHISNIYKREEFRRKSVIADVVNGQISGLGINSYKLGLIGLIEIARDRKIEQQTKKYKGTTKKK